MARKAVDMIEPVYAAAPSLQSGRPLTNAYYALGSAYVDSGKFDEGLMRLTRTRS
jgi:hypothetical protein